MNKIIGLGFCIGAMFVQIAVLASSGPESRTSTDPKSIHSESNPAAKPVPIDDLFLTRSIGGGAWSPDEREIAFGTNASGRTNVWKMHADGSSATQLTRSDERQFGAAWSSDRNWIVYQQDLGGAEIWDIFAVPAAGGDPLNLTNTEKIAESSPLWSTDGSNIAIAYKPKESPVTDIAILNWKRAKLRSLRMNKNRTIAEALQPGRAMANPFWQATA